jgi:hypothetical protein
MLEAIWRHKPDIHDSAHLTARPLFLRSSQKERQIIDRTCTPPGIQAYPAAAMAMHGRESVSTCAPTTTWYTQLRWRIFRSKRNDITHMTHTTRPHTLTRIGRACTKSPNHQKSAKPADMDDGCTSRRVRAPALRRHVLKPSHVSAYRSEKGCVCVQLAHALHFVSRPSPPIGDRVRHRPRV